jgi:hypothetical protein
MSVHQETYQDYSPSWRSPGEPVVERPFPDASVLTEAMIKEGVRYWCWADATIYSERESVVGLYQTMFAAREDQALASPA